MSPADFPIIPAHVLEQEPGLTWVTCPACDGEGWVLDARPNTWTGGDAFTPCLRCGSAGEVLEPVAPEGSVGWLLSEMAA